MANASTTSSAEPGVAVSRRLRVLHYVRVYWRDRVKTRWHYARPVVLLTLGVSVLVLGTIGYERYTVITNGQSTRPYDFFDSLYRAITLFGFGGTVAPPVPVTLQIARIVAPLLTGYAAVGTILALSREQARVLGIRLFVRRHVIIAGLGSTGSRLARSLVEKEPVVVLEHDPANEHLPTAAARGVRTLPGKATDEIMLKRAGIEHARMLVISCGSDGTNIDVAAAAARALGRSRHPLTMFIHLNDVDLWTSLAVEGATFGSPPAGLRLEYFNVLATGAQLMIEQHPPFAPEPTPGQSSHVLIVGLEGVGEPLVLQIARTWRSVRAHPQNRLRVTLTGTDAKRDLARLRERYPSLERYCELAARPAAIESAAFQAGAVMLGEDGRCDVTRAYVCIKDPADAMLGALALHARPDAYNVPVAVALPDSDAGVGVALTSQDGRLAGIDPFGVLTAATSSDLLLRGMNELFARAQHAQWLRVQEAQGVTALQKPALKPWDQLDEVEREVNRKFADDIQHKLRLVDCMLVPMPLPDPDEQLFEFSAAEIEQLAQEEHVRWMDDKLANGWRYGPKRDNSRKIHDQIKPWTELDEVNRDYDRDAVRALPETLELAGFKIQKRGKAS